MADVAERTRVRLFVGEPGYALARWRSAVNIRAWPVTRQILLALMVLYIGKELINVIVFPPFTGHDEVAHFSYLQTVATEHRVPILLKDRLPDDMYRYCEYVLAWDCFPGWTYRNPPKFANYGAAGEHPIGMQYAANHPPLYYVLMTPVYWLTAGKSEEGQQYFIRAATIPFGVLAVLFAYLLVMTLFPGDAFLAIVVPAFVALQPQVSYEAAMVNNDIVCIALYGALLWLSVRGMRDRFPYRDCIVIGVILGLALLSKGTSLTALAPVGLAIFLGVGWRRIREWMTRGVIVGAASLFVAWPWYLFLYRTYGNFSGLAQIKQLQSAWNHPEGGFFDLLWNRSFAVMRWNETWGEFGWRKIPLSTSLLWQIAIPLLLALIGLGYYAMRAKIGNSDERTSRRDPIFHLAQWQALALLMLFLTCVIAYLAVVQFGTSFQLTQARYYFPVVSAAGLLLALGVRAVMPRRALPYVQTVCLVLLIVLNLAIYTQYVIPYWHGPD
jgi:4-amino-4-deoxy-L-arabinose transferase-like glycosyltransferase